MSNRFNQPACFIARLSNRFAQCAAWCWLLGSWLLGSSLLWSTLSLTSYAQYPGTLPPVTAEASDQKAGSVLFYNLFASSAASPTTQNTQLTLTNTNLTTAVKVRLFFVMDDGTHGSTVVNLAAAQTYSVLTSQLAPGLKGYVMAVAVNNALCPIQFNYLTGQAALKFSSGHQAALGAVAVSALTDPPAACSGVSTNLNFDGSSYNRLARTLALNNFGSFADGNSTLLAINRVGGDLTPGGLAGTTGTLFGVVADDAEALYSFSQTGATQVFGTMSNNFPRTTPQLSTIISAGRSGWLKTWNNSTDTALLGAAVNYNPSANLQSNAFNSGWNLAHYTLSAAGSYAIPLNGPDLILSKTHSGAFPRGTTSTYTIVVTNQGSAMTSGLNTLTVTDQLPGNLTLDPASGGTGWQCSGFNTANVSCTTNVSLGAGASSAPLQLIVQVGLGTPLGTNSITNTASVSNPQDLNPNNNTAVDPTSVVCQPYALSLTGQAVPVAGGNQSVAVTDNSACGWTAVSNVPWITVTSGGSGTGNGTVNYTVAANPNPTPRIGSLTIAGISFYVSQAAVSLLLTTDFSGGIPPGWTVVDGGSGGGAAATWTAANPCNRVIPPPFDGQFAIVDSACAGLNAVQDEQLITPPFNATGLGQVVLQFENQFHWFAGGQNEIADVDVTTNDGATWTNVLRMQGGDDGFPTPNTKSVNLTPFIASNPANVRLRFRYYTTASASLPRQNGQPPNAGQLRRPSGPTSQELWWGIDRPQVATLNISPQTQTFANAGGTGNINVTTAPGINWTAQSNVPWISILSTNAAGAGVVNYAVTGNPQTTRRTGTLTVAENTFTVTQFTNCTPLSISPTTLPNALVGVSYQQQLSQTGGIGASTWTSSGTLPPGLTLNASTGLLAGTPNTTGTFNFTVRATDANFCFGERSYSVVVSNCPAITLSPTSLASGFQGTVYNQTFTASGGSAPYTFAVTSGSLPGGLSLASGGALTGTPTASGTFSFTVTATDATGCTGTRSYSVIVSGNGLQFFPLAAPVRLLDTRTGATACTQPNAPVAGQTSLTQVGRNFCGIPANAVALTGNISTINSGGGFLTLYPSDAAQPTVANSTYGVNEVINNVFTVGLGAADGAFKIFAFNTTDVAVDVTGYYAPPATGGLYFHPLPAPVRLLDTRMGATGCVTPGAALPGNADSTQQAITPCTGIPAAARALVGNATTISPQGFGYLTLFPGDAPRPLAASSTYGPGQTVNGPFTVGLAANGEFKIYTFAATDLAVDIVGYYSTEANDANGAGLLFTPLPKPVRLLETRNLPTGCFKPNAPLNGQQEYTQVAQGTCDGVTIPTNARGIVGNATAVTPNGFGFLTLWPSGATRPLVATATYSPGEVTNRHFIVGLGAGDGAFKMYTFATSHLVIDLAGYFAP